MNPTHSTFDETLFDEPPAEGPEGDEAALVVAGKGWGIRALAYVIDTALIYGLQFLGAMGGGFFVGLIVTLLGQPITVEQSSLEGSQFLALGLIFSVLYFTFLEGWFGATVAKFLLRLRVVKADGRPCDLRAAFIRALLRFVDGLFAGMVAAASMKPPLQQRLGDRAASTVVVSAGMTTIPKLRRWWWLAWATVLYLVMVMGTVGMVLFIANVGETQSLPDLSEAVLTRRDLPDDFIELYPDKLGFGEGKSLGGGYEIESAFAAMRGEPFEMLLGFTILLPREENRSAFDRDIREEKELLGSFITGIEQEGGSVSESDELSDLGPIGDAAAGLTMVVNAEDMPLRLDVVAFRRDVVGALLVGMYPLGAEAAMPVGEAARRLDERVQAVLEGR